MRRSLVATLLLLSCAPLAPPKGTCDVHARGNVDNRFRDDGLTDAIVQDMLGRALDGLQFVTDWSIKDPEEMCQRVAGYYVFTKPPVGPFLLDGQQVMGYTECWFKNIVIAAPADGVWAHSALIHEFYHAFQDCKATRPVDPGMSPDHANWRRNEIQSAVDYEMSLP
jgi:hypothetical protein